MMVLKLAGVFEVGSGIRYQLGQMLSVRAGVELWYLDGMATAQINSSTTSFVRRPGAPFKSTVTYLLQVCRLGRAEVLAFTDDSMLHQSLSRHAKFSIGEVELQVTRPHLSQPGDPHQIASM